MNDQMSFMRFLGLTLADDIPDSRTVCHFREQLSNTGLVEKLFGLFLEKLESLNSIVNERKIIDASFVEVPRQRNCKEEQKASNREKSRTSSQVKHIFGFMENSMNEMYIQCIEIRRATAVIGLMNLTYNYVP